MDSHRAGDIVKTSLPKHGIVEESLYENHFGKEAHLIPAIQASFGTRQKAMRWRRSRDAASVEITLQWKGDPMLICIVAGGGHQAGSLQGCQRVVQLHQPAAQTTARRIADPHVLDQLRRVDSPLVQIRDSLAVPM